MKCRCIDGTCNECLKKDVVATGSSASKTEKAGYLYTISRKSFLSREKWKRRYFALEGTKLYRSHKKEDLRIDPNCRFIGLECYDVHLPSDVKDDVEGSKDWKRDHVFFLVTSSNVASRNDKARLVFSSESKADLLDWVANLRHAASHNREKSRPQRPPRSKDTPIPHSSSPLKRAEEISWSSSANASEQRLYNANKYRAHGPKGRRLPQRKYRQSTGVLENYRTSSLCELDMKDEDMDEENHQIESNSSKEEEKFGKLRACSTENLAYQYSSSEDSSSFRKSKESNAKDDEQKKKPSSIEYSVPEKSKEVSVQSTDDREPEKIANMLHVDEKAEKIECDKRDIIGHRYQPQSNGLEFYDQLAERLKVMNGSLNRFQEQVDDELKFIRECLGTTLPSVAQIETPSTPAAGKDLSRQDIDVLKDLYKAEDDLQRLVIIMNKVKTSLGFVVFHCNKELSKTSEL